MGYKLTRGIEQHMNFGQDDNRYRKLLFEREPVTNISGNTTSINQRGGWQTSNWKG